MATTYKFDLPEAAYAEAERRIEVARSGNVADLDLTYLGLTSVPESLWQLINLKRLDFRMKIITMTDSAYKMAKTVGLEATLS